VLLLSAVAATFVAQFPWSSNARPIDPLPRFLEGPAREARFVLGFIEPNVFNATDLRMGEQWWSATWTAPGGRSGVVPLNRLDAGAREHYHRSDILYFGNSLTWRRSTIGVDLTAISQPGTFQRSLIDFVLRYHRRREGGPGPFRYEVRLFRDNAANVTLPPDIRFRPTEVPGFTTEMR
jgi:hypothetical protein